MDHDALLGGRYRRVRVVGAGAMGEVWQGEDTLLQRPVAIKRILAHALATDPTLADRLLREARLAARLDHSHAVTVHDVVVEDGLPHLVMQFVAGRTLAQRVAERPFAAAELAPLLTGVADALATAHALGIVHRDIKPANILLDDRGRALLADFGIARGEADSRLTGTGSFIGTPAFLAPELLHGATATAASDVYALGATMYAATDGRAPFDDGDSAPLVLLSRMLTRPLTPPRHAGSLTGLVMAMLAADPHRRPSAAQVAAALAEPVPSADDRPTMRGRLPVAVDSVDPVDPLDTLIGAIVHADVVSSGWSGRPAEWDSLVVAEFAPRLEPGDRVDLFVPCLFGLDDRARAFVPARIGRSLAQFRAGGIVALADRFVCAWTANERTLASAATTIPYGLVRGVRPQVFVEEGVEYQGLELVFDQFGWPVVFADRARLRELPDLLAGRADGSVLPEWDDGDVAVWTIADRLSPDRRRVPGWRDQ